MQVGKVAEEILVAGFRSLRLLVVDAEMPVAISPDPYRRNEGILLLRIGPVIPPIEALVRDCAALADQLLRMREAALVDLNGQSGFARSWASAARSIAYGCWPCAAA